MIRLLRLCLILLLLLAVLILWLSRPGEFRAIGWQAPPPPTLDGVLAVNDQLAMAEGIALGAGPEAVAFRRDGTVVTGTADGTIWALPPDRPPQRLVSTGGRPLGLHEAPDGSLYIADGVRGLLRLVEGTLTVVADHHEGRPLRVVDDVVVAADGTVYFTDASQRFGLADYRLDLLSGHGTGRLFQIPRDGTPSVLLEGLYFANGLTLSADGNALLVNETARYRITRLWLHGPRAGQQDVFADNLPGFPDNITTRPDGSGYWVALPSRRNPFLDAISPHAWLRNLVARLPAALQPAPERHAMVLLLDPEGRILAAPQDPEARITHAVTSARERDGSLWLGSLHADHLARWALPESLQPAPGTAARPTARMPDQP